MEQHKTLLIIVSIAVVLAAIIGGGIWLFYPRTPGDAMAQSENRLPSGGLEWEPSDFLLSDGDRPGLDSEEDPEPDEFQVTYGVVYDAQPQTGPAGDSNEPPPGTGSRTPFVTQADTATPSAASSDAAATASPSSRASSGVQTTQPASTTASPAQTTASPRTTESATTTSPASSTTRSSASAAGTSSSGSDSATTADRAYWVQVISSPNRDTVEQAQRTLREHQLGSRILTKEIEGTTYFRVRLGPFAVRSEAEKFLDWVTEINGFAGSMIFVDYSTTVKAAESS